MPGVVREEDRAAALAIYLTGRENQAATGPINGTAPNPVRNAADAVAAQGKGKVKLAYLQLGWAATDDPKSTPPYGFVDVKQQVAKRFGMDPEHAARNMITLAVFDTAREVRAVTQVLTRISGPIQRWNDDAAGLLSRAEANRVRLDGIETHGIMLAMPLEHAQRQVTDGGMGQRLGNFPGEHFFELDFLGVHVRINYSQSGGIEYLNCRNWPMEK